MTKEEKQFYSIGEEIKDSSQGKLFGKPCFKINGKAFACFFEDAMVFKLTGDIYSAALGYDGSQLFDPSGKKRPMKEWVQISYKHKDKWLTLANEAKKYVLSMQK